MQREFIRTQVFEADWKNAGLNDNDLRELENILLDNPKAGDVIPHLSGGRKVRFAAGGRGKSGGVRVIYVDIVIREQIYLLLAYTKNVRTDLTPIEKKALNKIIAVIKEG
jgi:hypothetical protein